MKPALLGQSSERENECENQKLSQRILVNGIQQYIKVIIHHEKTGIYPRNKRMVHSLKINQYNSPDLV